MNELAQKKCVPCSGGVPALSGDDLVQLSKKLGETWKIIDEHHLEREFRFKDFKTALEFTNKVGAIAEAEAHHPDIQLSWGRVVVKTWTHKAFGLTENDFILAAKIDAIA